MEGTCQPGMCRLTLISFSWFTDQVFSISMYLHSPYLVHISQVCDAWSDYIFMVYWLCKIYVKFSWLGQFLHCHTCTWSMHITQAYVILHWPHFHMLSKNQCRHLVWKFCRDVKKYLGFSLKYPFTNSICDRKTDELRHMKTSSLKCKDQTLLGFVYASILIEFS
jgi:hypothetical protein